MLHDKNARVQFHAAMALGKMGNPDAAPHLISLLDRNNNKDAYIRHAAIMGLTGCALPEQLTNQYQHKSPAVRAAIVATLRRLRHPAIKAFLADPSDWVLKEAISAVHDDRSIPEALPDIAVFNTALVRVGVVRVLFVSVSVPLIKETVPVKFGKVIVLSAVGSVTTTVVSYASSVAPSKTILVSNTEVPALRAAISVFIATTASTTSVESAIVPLAPVKLEISPTSAAVKL